VGEGALLPIIKARQEGGSFTSLGDFCRRVDLRQVPKRTLESLIKVGVFDAFGKRWQTADPASLERLVNFSVDYHKAKEIGQMSMFGGDSGVTDSLTLPEVPEVPQREMLKWEKELLGVYVSGRPADKVKESLKYANTIEIAELKTSGVSAMKQAKIAGEIVALRKMVTKSGQMMAVARLEDWRDSAEAIDVVLFPRTWEKFQDIVKEGAILVMAGKVDASRSELQIIADMVSQNANAVAPEQIEFASPSSEPPPWAVDDLPPEPPPDFPEPVAIVAPATQGAAAVRTPAVVPQLLAQTRSALDEANWDEPGGFSEMDNLEEPATPERWLMIYLRRSDDADQDRRRLRRLHGLLTQYPGKDRFTIVIEDSKSAYKMEFPNNTTDYCDDLVQELLTIVEEQQNIQLFNNPG
jgi:DNA polymerase III subunit alpha